MLTRNVVIFAVVAIAIVIAVIYFSMQEDDEDEKKEKDDSRVPLPPITNPDKVESATTKEGEEKQPKKEYIKKFSNIGGFESSMVKQVNMTSSEALKLSPDMEKGIYARGTSGNEQIQELVFQYRPSLFETMNKKQ